MKLATEFRINGPARIGYAGDETNRFIGENVTCTHREALSKHPSPAAQPVPCKRADGSLIWIKPIHLALPLKP